MAAASVYAWILTDSSGYSFAVSEVEMVEYLIDPVTMPIPLTPSYCKSVMPWRDDLLPVFHYHHLFRSYANRNNKHVGVLAYQERAGEALRYVAVALNQAPSRVEVTDEKSRKLPNVYIKPIYQPLVRSVFQHNGISIPVIDVTYLTSIALRDALHDDREATDS